MSREGHILDALASGYAKDHPQVYFRDEALRCGDAATFDVLDSRTCGDDARDAKERTSLPVQSQRRRPHHVG